jgi:hypothetical protein
MSDQHIKRRCTLQGCDREQLAKGLCSAHYDQQREGRPFKPIRKRRPNATPPVIEWDEVPCPRADLAGPCHVYRGKRSVWGYKNVYIQGVAVKVHRYVWELANGPIPTGLVIDHQCRNRACININHLRVVTLKVNSTENCEGTVWQIQLAKTHCPKGHPYDAENTHRKKSGSRDCRQCDRDRWPIKAEQRRQRVLKKRHEKGGGK